MAEQNEFNQQKELIANENMDSLTPSTSNPSDNPGKRSPSKKKTVSIFPFSWPKIFDSKFMSLLSKQDLVLKKIIKAIEEDRKQDILQLGNYYKSYLNNLHVSGGCLYLDNRLVIPACLRSTMLNRIHEAHPGQFAMKSLATQYIWWPKIYREIQVYGENCIECVKADKGKKLMSRERKHDWDAPDDIEDGDVDENSSSPEDISNAVRYVPTSAGSPVKVLSRAEKRDALGIKDSILNNPPAIKRHCTQKKPSPRKRDQLVRFYATKGLRKTTKPPRNVGFKSSRTTQKKRNLQWKFEELDIARRNAAMNSSRETLLREEEEQRKRLRIPIGLEIDQESSPSGKPDLQKSCVNEPGLMIEPNEEISDDNASDLISLKDLKDKTFLEATKSDEHLISDRTDRKLEIPDHVEQKVELDKIPLIDLDSGDNERDIQVTPQLVLLDTMEEANQPNQEKPLLPENPAREFTEISVEPIAMAEAESKQLYSDLATKKPKLSGTAKRKASSPTKSPPSKKLSEIFTRQNTRPMRTRQPPKMLGERVFTSVVDLTNEDQDGPLFSSPSPAPAYTTIEATTVEMASHQVDLVDLTTLTPPSCSRPTIIHLREESSAYPSDPKPSVADDQHNPRKKVKFSPEVCITQFDPSGLPSETSSSTSAHTVPDPDWPNTSSIISAIELLGRPMTLEELRRWTINKAANRETNEK